MTDSLVKQTLEAWLSRNLIHRVVIIYAGGSEEAFLSAYSIKSSRRGNQKLECVLFSCISVFHSSVHL